MQFTTRQLRLIGLLFSIGLTLALAFSLDSQYKYSKNFIPVEANVVGIETRYRQDPSNSLNSYKVAIYSFEVNGKVYKSSQELLPSVLTTLGSQKVVYYNPENPAELRDTYQLVTTSLVFIAMILATCCISYVELKEFKYDRFKSRQV